MEYHKFVSTNQERKVKIRGTKNENESGTQPIVYKCILVLVANDSHLQGGISRNNVSRLGNYITTLGNIVA